MRKVTKDRYIYICFHQKLLLKKRKKRANRKIKTISSLFSKRTKITPIRLVAPSIFCIHEQKNRANLISFFRELRSNVVQKKAPVLIDFSSTTKMVASGALLFVAELRRAHSLTAGKVQIRCLPPHNTKAWQVLEQINVLSLLKCRKRVKPVDDDVVHWRFAWGDKVLGEKYDDILGHYDGKLTEAISKGLYHGLTEAMTNCRQHAYIGSRRDELNIPSEPTNWWMFSQEKDNFLTVVFCDLGIGIPNTLPIKKPELWQRLIQTFLGRISDGLAIREAIKDSLSRTGKSYRGKGLRQLLEAVQLSNNGILMVYSNNGLYTYASGKENNYDYKESISGTLIAWKIPIK